MLKITIGINICSVCLALKTTTVTKNISYNCIKSIKKLKIFLLTQFVLFQVTRVLFDSKNRAIGVVYIRDGRERILFAKKEVILSAGSIASPQLLLLSGVGPKKHLQEKGKQVVV